jgi:hypothetical protein
MTSEKAACLPARQYALVKARGFHLPWCVFVLL